jgi:hypothetical protein
MLLALDPARRTGYALCEPWASGKPRIKCGSWSLSQDATIQERVGELALHLTRLTAAQPIDYAFVEIPVSDVHTKELIVEGKMGPEKQKQVLGNMRSVTQLWAYHGCIVGILSALRIPYRAEVARTWRAGVWRGEGNMKKAVAIEKAREVVRRFDIYCENDDERTAACMMFFINGNVSRWKLEDKFK